MTQEQINAIAAVVRDGGIPDCCNRWIGMTPEALAENELAKLRIRKRMQFGERRLKRERVKFGLDVPRSMDEASLALKRELDAAAAKAERDAEREKKRRAAARREFMKKIGAESRARKKAHSS